MIPEFYALQARINYVNECRLEQPCNLMTKAQSDDSLISEKYQPDGRWSSLSSLATSEKGVRSSVIF
jgi:hypothetical protein